jgi:lysozyme
MTAIEQAKAVVKRWAARRKKAIEERERSDKVLARWRKKIKDLTKPKPKPPAPGPIVATGIDVSSFQGKVDFAKVKAAGRAFVYCKATEGVGFTDAFFHANVRAARAVGLEVGAYHFLRPRPGRTGGAEAREFATALKAAGLTKGKCLRPVVDVEVTALARLSAEPAAGEGRMGAFYHNDPARTLGADHLTAAGPTATEAYVAQFVAELQKLTGITPLIYTFPAFLRWQSTHDCPLWIANFGVKTPTIPGPWKRYAIWQHSSTARVPGVAGNCDVNRCPDLRAITS